LFHTTAAGACALLLAVPVFRNPLLLFIAELRKEMNFEEKIPGCDSNLNSIAITRSETGTTALSPRKNAQKMSAVKLRLRLLTKAEDIPQGLKP
jgi:hypothetical protein